MSEQKTTTVAPGIDKTVYHYLEANLPPEFEKFIHPGRRQAHAAYDNMASRMTDWMEKHPNAVAPSSATANWTPETVIQFMERKETSDETRQVMAKMASFLLRRVPV